MIEINGVEITYDKVMAHRLTPHGRYCKLNKRGVNNYAKQTY